MSRRILARSRRISRSPLGCRRRPCRWWRPTLVAVRGDWGVGFIEVGVNVGIAGEGVCFRAVREVVDVFGADDVYEFERGLALLAGLAPEFEPALAFGREE